MPVLQQLRLNGVNWTLRGGNVEPNTALEPGARGDLYVRTDTAALYINTDGTTTGWIQTSAVPADWTATAALTWTLADNIADSLRIGSAGLASLLSFNTNDGAESVIFAGGGTFQVNGGGLAVVEGGFATPHLAFADYAVGTPGVKLLVEVAHPGGNVDGSVVLPARVGGWKMTDATLRSLGATAGTITARTAAGGGGTAVTDAMVPGNNHVITRATQLDDAAQTFASGATVFFNGAGGPPATTVYAEFVGL